MSPRLIQSQLPSQHYEVITPADGTDLPDYNSRRVNAIYVGGLGNIVVRDDLGNDVTFTAVPVGTILPISPKRILSTGTTATLIIGLYGDS
jgi:hypothetical protein